MIQHISFRDLKARVGVDDIIRHYGWQARARGSERIVRCPVHDDRQASLNIDAERGMFQCFGCSISGGDIIDLVAAVEGKALRQAALLIDRWFPDGGATADVSVIDQALTAPHETDAPSTPNATAPALDEPTPAVNEVLEFTLPVDQSHPYLAERGLQPDTIREFDIGYCTSTRSMMKGRIVIPIHDWHPETPSANLVAYAGRWPEDTVPDETPKYLFPPRFHKSVVVYNLFAAQRYAPDDGLVIVEGFFPVMHLWQVGIRTGVALMGTTFTKGQEELIVQTAGAYTGKVTLMLDPDGAGRACRDDALMRLCPRLHVRVVDLSVAPDELSDAELRVAVLGP